MYVPLERGKDASCLQARAETTSAIIEDSGADIDSKRNEAGEPEEHGKDLDAENRELVR